jgi:hypothetical protein
MSPMLKKAIQMAKKKAQWERDFEAQDVKEQLHQITDEPVRWTLKVSRDTDIAVRTFLARRGMKKGDLTKFVEEAVRWRVFDQTVTEVQARNAGAPAQQIEYEIEEALATVRVRRSSLPRE